MILLASVTYTFTVQAADACLPHTCAMMQDGNDCQDGGRSSAANDCADCLHHCHGSFPVIGGKLASLSLISGKDAFSAPVDDFPPDGISSGSLKPPRAA